MFCFVIRDVQWIMTEVSNSECPGDDKPWVPERVKKALENAADFGEFRSRREFTFLHLFAGKKDVLGEEICRAASEKGLVATVTRIMMDRTFRMKSPTSPSSQTSIEASLTESTQASLAVLSRW